MKIFTQELEARINNIITGITLLTQLTQKYPHTLEILQIIHNSEKTYDTNITPTDDENIVMQHILQLITQVATGKIDLQDAIKDPILQQFQHP